MIETNIPSIDVEDLMRSINEGVRKASKRSSALIAGEISSFAGNDVVAAEEKIIPIKDCYSIHDFLGFSNEYFIANAYRALMQREPHDGELVHILNLLERGELTRVEVLSDIRFSLEGKEKNVKVKGLRLPFVVRRVFNVPVIGKFVELLSCTYRLPMLFKNVRHLNNSIKQIQEKKLDKARYVQSLRSIMLAINDLEEKFTSWQQQSDHQIDILLRGFSERQQAEIDDFLSDLEGYKHEVVNAVDVLTQEAKNAIKEEFNVRVPEIVTLQRQLQRLKKDFHSEGLPIETISRKQVLQGEVTTPSTSSIPLDSLYVALENRFRGKTEDINNRLQVYLPYVQGVVQRIPDGEALDVGCGRGEWLELMRDAKIPAVGVDLNAHMLDAAKERGLKVVCDNLFNYFQGVKDDSLAIISGFHIVEHLPFDNLVLLLDESLRSLQEGGLVIFETPNPENLLTGACNFYIDPTHKNPIPPQLLEFLFKNRGFRRVEILRLHPNDSVQLNDPRVEELLFGPQDYAVLGWK